MKKVILLMVLFLIVTVKSSWGHQWDGSTNTTDSIFRTGNVGIGTTSPDARLHVHGTALGSSSIGLLLTREGGGPLMRFLEQGGNVAEIHFDGSSLNIQNGSGGPLGNITLNGNVGIGTTSPDARLHVHGTAAGSSSTGLLLTREGGGPLMRFLEQGGNVAEIHFDGSSLNITNGSGGPLGNIALNGNVGIGTTDAVYPLHMASGAHVTAGGVWTNGSDKNKKENFAPVDGQELLDKIAALPIERWNYKDEDENVQHIGPVAQDFEAAFGLGGDGKSISTIDPSGIALAAIKELVRQNEELRLRVERLEGR